MHAHFPDQFAVEFIRDSLWNTGPGGRASVMVGAGFSRNARAVSPSSRPMPTWAQMSSALCAALYASSGEDAFAQAMHEASSTSGFLRLAQEYEAAYGRVALDQQIRNLVPDLDYQPSDLHHRILSLPWADVFTTNWDTLLERASRDVFDYNYDIVRTASEIPKSSSPRIVKLHGSFPAFEPFVFTEDDYRTYPRSHAPFVNMVQQGLMESALCLLGFSGDDPNFLYWSGWVRDNLGKTAPKIFLVGWLDLSPHRRKLLEARNVVPVDLSYLPAASNWPKHLRHQYSTEWFLRAVSVKKRFDPSTWPLTQHVSEDSPVHLGTVPARPHEDLPASEPAPPGHAVDDAEKAQLVAEAVKTWSINRTLYPGWVIAPATSRQHLWLRTIDWIQPIADVENTIPVSDYILILDELLWRLDIALKPYFQQTIDAVRRTVQKIDVLNGSIVERDGMLSSEHVPQWPKIIFAWARLALTLARDARMDGHLDGDFPYLNILSSLAIHDEELGNSLNYQLCLWYRSKGDLGRFEQLISRWSASNADTVWAIRKAGLLAYLGRHTAAIEIATLALSEIRRNRRRDIVDFRALSREAWALWFQVASDDNLTDGSAGRLSGTHARNRWRELAFYRCDAFAEYQQIVTNIDLSLAEAQATLESERTFDLGTVSETVHLTNSIPDRIINGYELFLLAEIAGVPSGLVRTSLIGEGLRKAVQKLADDSQWLCANWAVSIATSAKDQALKFFTRERIASLTSLHAEGLRQLLLGEITHALHHLGENRKFWSNRLQVCIETLSRLVLRLPTPTVEQVLELALSLLRNPTIIDDSGFHSAVENLLRRTLETLPSDRTDSMLETLFELPLSSSNREADQSLPDPAHLLPNLGSSVQFEAANWSAISNRLIQEFEGGTDFSRNRALLRLFQLVKLGIADHSMKSAIAEAVWRPENLHEDGWPKNLLIRDFAILGLPENSPGQADILFRQRYLTLESSIPIPTRITELGEAIKYRNQQNLSFPLNNEERKILQRLILAWISLPSAAATGLHKFFQRINGQPGERETLKSLATLFPIAQLSHADAKIAWEKVSSADIDEMDVALPALSSLLISIPENAEILTQKLRHALVSSLVEECRGACAAIYQWIELNQTMDASPPLIAVDIIREVGLGVASRRLSLLLPGMELLAWIFKKGLKQYQEIVLADCVHALNYLHEQAKYDGELAKKQLIDVPLLRLRATQMATAVEAAGFPDESITRWLRSAENDPLPEIRKARESGMG